MAKPKSKFKGCFIDERPDYEYDILYEGETFARAKTLSALDQSIIEKKGFSRLYSEGGVVFEQDSNAIITTTIVRALLSWELDREINEQNVIMLTPGLRASIYAQIDAHETGAVKAVEDNEKN